MERQYLYFVTTIGDIIDNGYDNFPDITHSRTVGYFDTLEEAERCVKENWCDIYEAGYYKYAVIEALHAGLYTSCESTPIFYKWNRTLNGYQQIEQPECTKCYAGFTQVG